MTLNTYIHDTSDSLFVTGLSLKRGDVNIFPQQKYL
jgi:hypothetical protein